MCKVYKVTGAKLKAPGNADAMSKHKDNKDNSVKEITSALTVHQHKKTVSKEQRTKNKV